MATATAKEKTIKTVEEITLTLTPEEASALSAVLDSVGGSPHNTRRGLINEIAVALRDACPEFYDADRCAFLENMDLKGEMYFQSRGSAR